MQQKTKAIASVLTIGLLSGIATQYPEPFHVPEWITWTLVIAYGFSIYWWYHMDRIERGGKQSLILSAAMVGLPLAALPYYLFRTRGFRSGFRAFGIMIGIAALFLLLNVLGAIAVAWIRMQTE